MSLPEMGCDLRLMSSLNDVNGIPTEGKNLIVVAAVDNVLHFRIFDGDGKVVVDTDETRLTEQTRQIKDLRKQLQNLWPPYELTTSEKGRVTTAVTSIVGHTPEMDENLEGFRDYLMILAQTQIPIEMRGRIDPSDLVQETFLCAIRGDFHRREGRTDAQTTCWLREILRCRLIDRLPGRNCAARVKSLPGNFPVADQSTPSARIRRAEDAILVAELLAHLPEAQREAVVLRHCEGWPVEKIGRHMNLPPAAVGGLLKRGMKKLRELMPRGE